MARVPNANSIFLTDGINKKNGRVTKITGTRVCILKHAPSVTVNMPPITSPRFATGC